MESQNIQATLPRLSADGSEILFADVGGTEDPSAAVHVMAAPLAGGLPRLVLQDVGIDGFFCAKPAVTCAYNKASGNTASFIAFDSRNGQRREIANFDGWPVWALSPEAIPSPDGRSAALDVITGENNVWMIDVWMIDNF